MNVDFINPFLGAVVTVLKTMAFTNAVAGTPFVQHKAKPSHGDVTGVLGLTGPVHGAIALSFSEAAILEVITNMFGEAFKEINSEVQDAVGELTNMVCGDARRVLESKGYLFQASIPTVISGVSHSITHAIPEPSVVIPFTTDQDHAFFVEASFEEE